MPFQIGFKLCKDPACQANEFDLSSVSFRELLKVVDKIHMRSKHLIYFQRCAAVSRQGASKTSRLTHRKIPRQIGG